jgi:hypothetical protein
MKNSSEIESLRGTHEACKALAEARCRRSSGTAAGLTNGLVTLVDLEEDSGAS